MCKHKNTNNNPMISNEKCTQHIKYYKSNLYNSGPIIYNKILNVIGHYKLNYSIYTSIQNF